MKRVQNEQLRSETQKRKTEWPAGSNLGPVKKRRMLEGGVEMEVVEDTAEVIDLGGEDAEKATEHTVEHARSTNPIGGGDTGMGAGLHAIIERLDALLAGQKAIMNLLTNGPDVQRQ